MRILITGGGGFLGGKLAAALAARGALRGAPIEALTLADLTPPPPVAAPFPVRGVALDIVDSEAARSLFADRVDVVFHLAAVVSGQAEADFDAGLDANLFGSINLLEAARAAGASPIFVFASSIAVFGGGAARAIDDMTGPSPRSSYGAQKAAVELLVNDYARKGFIDGRALRLPTISIRPGKPNKAASSFMSSIFREPLQGETAVCPVSPNYAHWFLSPRRCVENLIHGAEVPAEDFGEDRRLTLPGRTHTIRAMIDAMRRVAGEATAALITWAPDSAVQAIVESWPARFDPAKALDLGFVADASFEENIRFFIEDDRAR